ncbi:PIN domain-containing protein [Pedobacter sp. MC2016-14]|uniref:PIN domain-containing protein n=1 Tax=Pedobacter sp. MC2016-14 TaxID=2897327 RepID=UPI001E4A6FB5|nr:PIN domain-containing protein [Pedobacter sp. MC2016-14]MCD0489948.1 PIN domain-containing protein [Pedobacter sp. MC2016-14]
MAENFIFLDTNILLHCKPAKDIPWENYVKGTYTFVIAPIVIDEIDKHKRNIKKSLAKRAKSITKLFEEIMENEVQGWLLIDKRPSVDIFTANGLDREEQDDRLLASLMQFSLENPESQIILISNDVGPRLKAKNLGIKVIKLSDKELLEEERDESEIKMQKLIRENNELRHRLPKVDLFFNGKTKFLTFKDFDCADTYEVFSAKQMQQLKKDYPYDNTPYRMPTKKELPYRNALDESSIHHYNTALDLFFQSYEYEYLPEVYNWKITRMLSIEFELEIYNEGNIPAEDIDLSLYFPQGIIVSDANTFNVFPNEPIPPSKPLSRYKLTEEMNELCKKNPVASTPATLNTNHWISIRNNGNCQVDMKHNNLKHNQSFKFMRLAVSFETLDYMKGFEFEYKLMIANEPNLKTGKLQVNFVKSRNLNAAFNLEGKKFVLSLLPKERSD